MELDNDMKDLHISQDGLLGINLLRATFFSQTSIVFIYSNCIVKMVIPTKIKLCVIYCLP